MKKETDEWSYYEKFVVLESLLAEGWLEHKIINGESMYRISKLGIEELKKTGRLK